MTVEELVYVESKLRDCFKSHLSQLNVNGNNDTCTVKIIKTYGALWHYAHQLLLAETGGINIGPDGYNTADTLDIQATNIRMPAKN